MRQLKRRQFTREAGLAFLGGVSISVSACGGGGGGYSSASTTPLPSGSEAGQVSGNHGHEAVITSAQLLAGGAVQLNIAGSAGHAHIVDLPAQAVQQIRDGKAVQKESTATDAHTHLVNFNMESPEPPTYY